MKGSTIKERGAKAGRFNPHLRNGWQGERVHSVEGNMPTIVVANPKGGSGKSTTSLVLGLTLARKGAKVTLIDADANHPLTTWHNGDTRELDVIGGLTDANFVSVLDREASQRDAVIVDLEGAATRIVSRAIMRADLVLIPMQASAVDAAQAGRAVGLIRQEEEILRRSIPLRIVLTRTSPQIVTRAQQHIVAEMQAAGIPALKTQLHERAGFKAIFEYKQALADLDPAKVNGLEAACANVEAFADEVTAILKSIVTERAAA
jgi:chromosome partitioning protein